MVRDANGRTHDRLGRYADEAGRLQGAVDLEEPDAWRAAFMDTGLMMRPAGRHGDVDLWEISAGGEARVLVERRGRECRLSPDTDPIGALGVFRSGEEETLAAVARRLLTETPPDESDGSPAMRLAKRIRWMDPRWRMHADGHGIRLLPPHTPGRTMRLRIAEHGWAYVERYLGSGRWMVAHRFHAFTPDPEPVEPDAAAEKTKPDEGKPDEDSTKRRRRKRKKEAGGDRRRKRFGYPVHVPGTEPEPESDDGNESDTGEGRPRRPVRARLAHGLRILLDAVDGSNTKTRMAGRIHQWLDRMIGLLDM